MEYWFKKATKTLSLAGVTASVFFLTKEIMWISLLDVKKCFWDEHFGKMAFYFVLQHM